MVEVAASFLRIACAGYVFLGFSSVFQGCLNGAGDTMIPLAIMVLNMWLLQVVLSLVLPRVTGLGVLGVRWAIVAGTFAAAVAYVVYFRMGRWKKKRV